MDTISLITIATVVVANIGTVIGLFTWATNHAASDAKSLRDSMEKSSQDTRRILESIQAEIKDFHGRLCSIEERNSKKILKD
jgi:hypothetical protein